MHPRAEVTIDSLYEHRILEHNNITYLFIHTALARTQGCVQNAQRLSKCLSKTALMIIKNY